MDMVVDFCAASGVLGFYRRQRGIHPLWIPVRKSEHATARNGLFGKGRTG